MIRTIRHKGLERLFEQDDPSGVNPEHAGKLRNILATLHAARTVDHMDLPGFRLHPLQGAFKGFWAVTVRATGGWFSVLTAARRTLIMSIATERKQPMTMKNPPHPGLVVLQECVVPSGLTITQAAEALGVTRNMLSELVNGKRGISPEMAVRLSKVFGGSDESWLVQQAQYDLAQVRRDRIKLKRLELV